METNDENDWSFNPGAGHIVQFYPYDSALLTALANFIGTGLEQNETCLVIATRAHTERLNTELYSRGFGVGEARAEGKYLTYDARELLDTFMGDKLPDHEKFTNVAASLLTMAEQRGRPLRVFGEMVAILWQEHKQTAVLQLEKYWNEVTSGRDLTLFCAYPMVQFDSYVHGEALSGIKHLHSFSTPAYANRAAPDAW
jgi:hypothetical protein